MCDVNWSKNLTTRVCWGFPTGPSAQDEPPNAGQGLVIRNDQPAVLYVPRKRVHIENT